ncbi:hypothetical protein [Gordonia metallireducens]|uniref:hypothetical protein n=1 Tax=Gordonia metallireducens TaxID=2897779 RepID=UPI001E4E9E72|nr:hypothetical protein [Gordonia metallireducens]
MAKSQRPKPVINDGDISVLALRDIVLRLPTAQPITDAFEAGGNGRAWYTSQQEHLAGWLYGYNGPGAYNRANPSTSSKSFYNRFRCAAGLLWLAEALGEDEIQLRNGVNAIRNAGSNPSSQCGAFRKVVPWTRILELVGQQPEAILQRQSPQRMRSLVARLSSRAARGNSRWSKVGKGDPIH